MGEADSPLLEVRGLVKDYPGVRALDGVDLTVTRGQVHCLIGQNGAGKSTLIKCVSGLVEPTAGEVRFEGEPLPVGDPTASIARGIATIYQELDLVPHLSVALNVFLGHERRRGPLLNQAAMHRETAALLARLGDEGIAPTASVTSLRPAATAGRLDGPGVVALGQAAHPRRAVGGPGRRRGGGAVQGGQAAHRRGSRDHLDLPPAGRGGAAGRPGDGAEGGPARWRPSCHPTARSTP